jgi:hypothetical protein
MTGSRSRPVLRAVDPHPPIPLTLTVAAAQHVYAYALNGPYLISHRRARPIVDEDNGLIVAIIHALRTVEPPTLAQIRKVHDKYRLHMQSRSSTPVPEQTRTPLQIRTDSPELVEAGAFVTTMNRDDFPVGLQYSLAKQLQRFDVTWKLLQPGVAEIALLADWAVNTCKPGLAATCPEESIADFRARVHTYDALQDEAA